MNVSVIIPTLNAGKHIRTLVASLKNQTCPPMEIIVIDSSSNDNTVSVAKEAGATVLTIPRSEFNHGLTRNLGVRHATGDILVFMTQDALPSNEKTIEILIQPITQGRTAAAYARQIPYHDADPIERFWRTYNYPATSVIKDVGQTFRKYFFSNVCSAFSKTVFERLGGFDEIEICEDVLMSYKLLHAGYRVAYQAEAMVKHSHNDSWRSKVSRYYRIGRFNGMYPQITRDSSNEKDGLATVNCLMENLLKHRKFGYAWMAVWDMLCRYISYKLGWFIASAKSRG